MGRFNIMIIKQRIANFNDWIEYFKEWQKDIGLKQKEIKEFPFEVKFAELPTNKIEYGDFTGEKKWETVMEIPDQRIRDGLLSLIVYQGDTEFASVEQQRSLFQTAPSDYDFQSLVRVMTDEMRHGWQICYLLTEYFGYSGRLEAQKLLERRSFNNNRLLGSFNEEVKNWLDFFTYTAFIDRDGKFQLLMLSRSAFAPLARSIGPMLKEESFHLGTGNDGLKRILKDEKIPTSIIQKYIYKWIPTAYDLFGTDHSSSAHWNYVWGLKGRVDEGETSAPLDKDKLNETARNHYHKEVLSIIENFNTLLPKDAQKLSAPDIRFHRNIGDFSGQPYDAEGNKLSPQEYEQYCTTWLPNDQDERNLASIFAEKDWITPKR